MSSRAWQMAAAFVSIGVMIYVLVVFGLRGDDAAAPTTPAGSQAHAGAAHHTAEPHQGRTLAPLQVFAGSVVGEWQAFETITQLPSSAPHARSNLVRVEAADDKQVTLVQSEREGSLGPVTTRRYQLPRQGMTIDELGGNDETETTLHGLTVSDDVHEVAGRAFKCKKLTFWLQSALGRGKLTDVEMWIAEEVPAGGLVELRQRFKDNPLTVTQRLVGFGTAGATTWGTKPDGLDAVNAATRD